MIKLYKYSFPFSIFPHGTGKCFQRRSSKETRSYPSKDRRIGRKSSKLESENAELKKEVQAVAKSVKEANSFSESFTIPQNEEEKKSFFNKLRIGLESDYDKSKGPWTQKETWRWNEKTSRDFRYANFWVIQIRSKETSIQGLIKFIIIMVTLDADGKEEHAKVQFYRDRVVSFESPF